MRFWIKKPPVKPIVKMVTPGRRSEGEDWREITIGIQDDKVQVVDNQPTSAPPEQRPIVVAGLGGMEMAAVDFLMEGARKTQAEKGKHPRDMSPAEYTKWLNETWWAFCDQKLKWFKGQTNIGPAGIFQREKPGKTHWN